MHAPQRDVERHLECFGGGGGDRLRGGSGERVSDELDRLADHIREPRGQPRMFERGSGAAQRRQVAFGHASRIEHRLRSSSAREPGVVRRRRGDAAECRLRHAINPESEQPRSGDAQQ